MSKIAMGVALLPSQEVMDRAIELNQKELVDKGNDKTILHPENCVPHMSLYIGCVEEKDLPEVERRLEAIAQGYRTLALQVDGVDILPLPNGETASGMKVIKTDQLQSLHERVMQAMMPLRVDDFGKDAVYSPPAVEDITLKLVKDYPNDACDKFNPHITLGIGESEIKEIRMSFTASKLALFHYGNYCTCRKELFSVKLKS